METRQDQEREEIWGNFCEESPEFSDPKSREHQVFKEVYQDEFKKSVDAGVLPYQDAIEQTRERATQRLGFEEVQASRVKAPLPRGPVVKKEERRKTASW